VTESSVVVVAAVIRIGYRLVAAVPPMVGAYLVQDLSSITDFAGEAAGSWDPPRREIGRRPCGGGRRIVIMKRLEGEAHEQKESEQEACL
jgi:hypothetical protein